MPNRRSSNRLQTKVVYVSVEGDCEGWYLDHLAELINSNDVKKEYGIKIIHSKKAPYAFAKVNGYKPREKLNGVELPFYHLQDIEDGNDPQFEKRIRNIIDSMGKAKKERNVPYSLKYSNFSFELWLLLHVCDMDCRLQNRRDYLKYINKYFNRHYHSLDDLKEMEEYKKLLKRYVTLDSVFQAVERAEKIMKKNSGHNIIKNYRNTKYYVENPALRVHELIQVIFQLCEIQFPLSSE